MTLPPLLDVLRRFGCTPAEAAALLLLALGGLAALGTVWLLARPAAAPAPVVGAAPAATELAASPTLPATESPSPTAELTEAPVVVHVAGLVRRPGLYTLPGGARVADALDAAGGPKPNASLDTVNLARPLADGEQLLVPARGTTTPPAPVAPAGTPAPTTTAPAIVSLNAASTAELEQLPGIGPVLAERIIAHRDEIGGFSEIGQLRDVSGIGEKTFQDLAPLVTP